MLVTAFCWTENSSLKYEHQIETGEKPTNDQLTCQQRWQAQNTGKVSHIRASSCPVAMGKDGRPCIPGISLQAPCQMGFRVVASREIQLHAYMMKQRRKANI